MLAAQLQCISETFLGESPKYLLNAAQKLLAKWEESINVIAAAYCVTAETNIQHNPASPVALCGLRITALSTMCYYVKQGRAVSRQQTAYQRTI